MLNRLFNIKNTILAIAFFATITVLTSCKNTYEPQPDLGYLTVYNMSPTLSTYDIYIDSKKSNSVPIPFYGGVKYGQFLAGDHEVKFTEAGNAQSLFTKSNVNLSNQEFNTFFLIGTTGNLESLILKDEFGIPESGKAYVRFINLSPDAPSVDFALKDSTTLASNKNYKDYSGFVALNVGIANFEVKNHNTGAVMTSLTTPKLQERFYYTLVVGGKVNAGNLERNFGLELITQQ